MKKRDGFTLIELLVVISIIALLISFLMPALAKAREQAKAAICMVHLKQWGIIWNMYTDENEGRFSTGMSVSTSATSHGWARGEWLAALESEWRSQKELLLCPSAVKPDDTKRVDYGVSYYYYGGPKSPYTMPTAASDPKFGEGQFCSYGANCWIFDPPPGLTNIQGRIAEDHWRKVDQKGADNIPVFADSQWRGGGPNVAAEFEAAYLPPNYNGEWNGPGAEMQHFCIDRHNGGINMLFMDFSVRAIPNLKHLWKMKWNRSWDINVGETPWWDWGLWLDNDYN